MDITWHGYSCFRMAERGALTVVTDPYDKSVGDDLGKLKADVITISRDAPAHNNANAVVGAQRGDIKRIVGPGEYEIGGVFVTGVAMKPRQNAAEGARATAYAFRFDGLNVAHLGGLAFVPTQAQIDALETVDVLLVPVGGGANGLTAAQASEVISLIEPSIVVPMHYRAEGLNPKEPLDTVAKFLKEMGLSDVKPQESLKVNRSQLPENTQVVLLDAKR